MKILFVAGLHHHEQLQAAIDRTPPGEPKPLFPPTVSQHFWERALRRRGCQLAIFYRNVPASGRVRAHHHREGMAAGKVIAAVRQRTPPELNPEYRGGKQSVVQQALECEPEILWLVGHNTLIYPQPLADI